MSGLEFNDGTSQLCSEVLWNHPKSLLGGGGDLLHALTAYCSSHKLEQTTTPNASNEEETH